MMARFGNFYNAKKVKTLKMHSAFWTGARIYLSQKNVGVMGTLRIKMPCER